MIKQIDVLCRAEWNAILFGLYTLMAATLVVGITGCRQEVPPPKINVVAKVGGAIISLEQLQAEWDRRSKGGVMVDQKKLLAEMVGREAAYQKAVQSGFLEKPEIQQALRSVVVDKYLEIREKDLALPAAITPELVRGYYDLHQKRFERPLAVNAAILQIESPRKATEERKATAVEMARAIRDKATHEAVGMAHFGNLAVAHSQDQATRYRGGELGWQTLEQARLRLPHAVAEQMFRITQAGTISEPIVTPEGIFLVKLIAQRPAQPRPFDEVRTQIEHELLKHRQTDRQYQLNEVVRQNIPIQINDEMLNQATTKITPRKDKTPPAMPKG